jgi:hypothetical protein
MVVEAIVVGILWLIPNWLEDLFTFDVSHLFLKLYLMYKFVSFQNIELGSFMIKCKSLVGHINGLGLCLFKYLHHLLLHHFSFLSKSSHMGFF